MIRDADGALQRQVGVLFEAGTLGGWGDGALLDRFASGRDPASEAAFACLVERHGPMVLRVCRAGLGDEHEAHDAFQAVFLVLARKARTVRIRDTIGPWLHGVAWRVAARARAAGLRRRRHERRAAEMAARSFEPKAGDDAESALHEEVRRLPEAFRAAVVLCDLEGLTTDGAAERLGVPVGTVRSRLYRGRDRLRGRLLRRGLAPAAVGAVVAVPASAVTVPAALAETTVRLAVGCLWAGAVPARLALLIHGGRHVMGIKGLAAVGVSLGLVVGVGGLAAQGPGDGPPKADRPGTTTTETVKTTNQGPPLQLRESTRTEDKPRPTSPPDRERLQGRWTIVGATINGHESPDANADLLSTVTVRGDEIQFANRDGRVGGSFSFLIDPDAEPGAMVVASHDPSDAQPVWWLYAFTRDKLRIAFETGKSPRRPRGFDQVDAEHPITVLELIRDERPPRDADPRPATTSEAPAPLAATIGTPPTSPTSERPATGPVEAADGPPGGLPLAEPGVGRRDGPRSVAGDVVGHQGDDRRRGGRRPQHAPGPDDVPRRRGRVRPVRVARGAEPLPLSDRPRGGAPGAPRRPDRAGRRQAPVVALRAEGRQAPDRGLALPRRHPAAEGLRGRRPRASAGGPRAGPRHPAAGRRRAGG